MIVMITVTTLTTTILTTMSYGMTLRHRFCDDDNLDDNKYTILQLACMLEQ